MAEFASAFFYCVGLASITAFAAALVGVGVATFLHGLEAVGRWFASKL